MENTQKAELASQLLIFLNSNQHLRLFTPTRKRWSFVASTDTIQTVQEITLNQLLALSTFELLELHKKIENAKRIKEFENRQKSYNSRF